MQTSFMIYLLTHVVFIAFITFTKYVIGVELYVILFVTCLVTRATIENC